MRAKRVLIGSSYVYTSDRVTYIGVLLCKLGLHKKRIRKNGKKLEYVCKRPHCNFCKKIRKSK